MTTDRALQAALTRGAERVATILAAPDMLSAAAFAARMAVSRATVRRKARRHEVLGLPGATRGIRYPAWQLGSDGQPFPALPALFGILGNDPWSVYQFLVDPRPELDDARPLQLLRKGQGAAVLRHAAAADEAFS